MLWTTEPSVSGPVTTLTRSVAEMLSIGMMACVTGMVHAQTSSTGSGQAYPNKPIRVVTLGAGGGSDFVARLISQGIATALGQQLIIDNRGTGLAVGDIVAKAPPDGYTLLVNASTH